MERLTRVSGSWDDAKEIIEVVLHRIGGVRLKDPVQRLSEQVQNPRSTATAKGKTSLHEEMAVEGEAKKASVADGGDDVAKCIS